MGDFMDGLVLVNKPIGITSHDLVQLARKKLQNKKIGHTGTLDPLAEGLMILTIGKSTKILPFLSHHMKEYLCTMKLGLQTDTLDSTGQILQTQPITPFTKEELFTVLQSFIGPSLQVPPMFSAKKHQGQHLYDLARNHQEVQRKPCPIEIKELELVDFTDDTITFRVLCSTGTYVRVLTQDIAEKLHNIAVMTALKRTKIDRFSLEDAYDIEQLHPDIAVLSNYDALKDYTYIHLKDPTMALLGKPMKFHSQDEMVMVVSEQQVIAAYQFNPSDGYYYSKRGLW